MNTDNETVAKIEATLTLIDRIGKPTVRDFNKEKERYLALFPEVYAIVHQAVQDAKKSKEPFTAA